MNNKLTMSAVGREVKMVTFMPDILYPSSSHWTLQGHKPRLIYLIFSALLSALNKIFFLCKYMVERNTLNFKESILMQGMEEENQAMGFFLS